MIDGQTRCMRRRYHSSGQTQSNTGSPYYSPCLTCRLAVCAPDHRVMVNHFGRLMRRPDQVSSHFFGEERIEELAKNEEAAYYLAIQQQRGHIATTQAAGSDRGRSKATSTKRHCYERNKRSSRWAGLLRSIDRSGVFLCLGNKTSSGVSPRMRMDSIL